MPLLQLTSVRVPAATSASDSPAFCSITSAASFWNFAGDKRAFPGLGLYTLAKISKDVSNCCYDIEVQAFMCPYKRGGTPVSCQARPLRHHLAVAPRASTAHLHSPPARLQRDAQVDGVCQTSQVIVRAKALGTHVDVIVRGDDTATVRYNGAETNFAPSFYDWTQSYGSPAVVTLVRVGMQGNRGTLYRWRVNFAFGGSVDLAPTFSNENARRFASNRIENDKQVYVYFKLPMHLASAATGACASGCNMQPKLPYNYCEGDANCLPTKVQDTLFTSSEVSALETACGIAAGASQRPNTCTNRPAGEVNCGMVSGTGANPAQGAKWPKNLGITNRRNSGGTGHAGTDMTLWSAQPNYINIAESKGGNNADGVCDAGNLCDGSCGASPSNACKSTNPGGCGGRIEDTDCNYDYEFRCARWASDFS